MQYVRVFCNSILAIFGGIMFFKKFIIGFLLLFGANSNSYAVTLCQQTKTVACDKVAVKSYVEDTGSVATITLQVAIEKLIGDKNNPKVYKLALDTVNTELSKMIIGTITLLGLSTVTKESIRIGVRKSLKELFTGSIVGTGITKGAAKLSQGMLIGIIVDIAKNVIQKVVYTTLKNEGFSTFKSGALAGAAVSLVEQSAIYATNGGSPYAILLAESEVLFTRITQIGVLAYDIDAIENDTEASLLSSDLSRLQLKYTKIFCQNNDMFPSKSMIDDINSRVDKLVKKYDESDYTDKGTLFKNKIAKRMYYHKLIYRFEVLEKWKKRKDKSEYIKCANQYFSPSERWFLKARYGITVPLYSDVDVDSRVHKDIYRLANLFNIKYITGGDTLSPNEYVGGKELSAWLDVLLRYVEKQDKKNYDESKYALISGLNYQAYLNTITYAQITSAFYKEIYGTSDNGNSYVVCFSDSKRRSNVSSIINEKLKKLKEGGIDITSSARFALKSYYDIAPRSLMKLNVLPANTLLVKAFRRKSLISFGARFLIGHRKNKSMMISCKD